jgi:uncharacterized protein DUF5309
MAVVSGQRRTDNIASSQRVIDMHKPILLLEPNAAPITTITNSIYNGGRRAAARDILFKWHEDELESRSDAINNGAGYSSSATSLVVDTGALFTQDDLVNVPRTGEVFLVTAVSTNTLTVVRGVSGTGAAALVDNDPVYVIGSAAAEGDVSFAARTYNPAPVSNYTQIFRNSVEASGSEMAVANVSDPHDWPYQQRKVGIEHRKDIELALLLGRASADAGDSSAGDRRATGGILSFATSNSLDAGGTLTEAEFEQWLRGFFRYGSQSRTVFAAPLVVSVLNQFAQGKLNTFVGAESYGVKVMEWISAHGTVKLVKHNLLEVGVYTGYAIAVDFEADVQYKYLGAPEAPGAARDTKLLTNRQENDRDGQKDEWLTECGLQFPQPKRHGVLTGVTG